MYREDLVCKIHNKKANKKCSTCGKAICEDCCNEILDEIENHCNKADVFKNIRTNKCLYCTVKELKLYMDCQNNSKWYFITFIAMLISYIIGLVIFIKAGAGGHRFKEILGLIIMGLVPGAKMAGFWDTIKPDKPISYDVQYTGFGNYQVTANEGGGLLWLIATLLGIIVTPIYIIDNFIKFMKERSIYNFCKKMINKSELAIGKKYVYNRKKVKWEFITLDTK